MLRFPLTLAVILALAWPALAQEGPEAVLAAQVEAWNRGDLAGFMGGYLNSPGTTFASGGSLLQGWQPVMERYRERYGASPETMGKLAFSDLQVRPLGSDHSLVLGRFRLERRGQPPLSGVFSLVFVRTAEGWKILHDHTSTEPGPQTPPQESPPE